MTRAFGLALIGADPSPSSVMRHPVCPDARISEYDAALVRSRAREVEP